MSSFFGDPYMQKIIRDINKISNGIFDDIKNLDTYPLDISKQVLRLLIRNSCLGQNCAPIEIGRKKIGQIANKDWLVKHFMEIADENINYSDDWEYRRLMELIMLHIPELKEDALLRGKDSENEEVREVVEEFKDK